MVSTRLIPKLNATLSVTTGQNNRFKFGENVTVFVELIDNKTGDGLNGTVIIIVNNTEIPVEITDGLGSYNVSGLDPGQYAVMGVFEGDANYNGPIYDASVFNVLRPDRTLSIEVEDINFGEVAVINITVTDNKGNKEKGTVILNISGKEFVVVVDGNKSVEITDIPVGEYTINATLVAEGLDTEVVNDTETFTVGQAASSVEIIGVVNATYPDDVVVTIEVVNATDLSVVISQNGAPVEATVVVSADNTTVTISGLGVGVYSINITNAATESYTGASDVALFNVSQATPVISVTADDVTYDDDVVVTVVSDVASDVTLTVGDKTVTDTVEAGVAKEFIISGFAANEEGYAIIVTLAETQNYTTGVNDTESVKVMKADSTVEIDSIDDVVYNASVEVSYKLENGTVKDIVVYDAYGDPITTGIDNSTAGKVIISGLDAVNTLLLFTMLVMKTTLNLIVVQHSMYLKLL